ncbi:MAG: hypothetical protein MK172_07255 [Verrucomicrobiales bacterium]|nr:hypothetical protein [Verrucomicrobiales bacterium]
MSMTTCPTCNKAISNNAFQCPHCGEPNTPGAIRERNRERALRNKEAREQEEEEANAWIGGIFVVIIVFICVYACS